MREQRAANETAQQKRPLKALDTDTQIHAGLDEGGAQADGLFAYLLFTQNADKPRVPGSASGL